MKCAKCGCKLHLRGKIKYDEQGMFKRDEQLARAKKRKEKGK